VNEPVLAAGDFPASLEQAPAWIERRQAVRFPAHDDVEIQVAGDPALKLSGFLRDASRTGVRLALPERVSRGAEVRIKLRGALVLLGQIRYCRCAGDIFYAGVLIHNMPATLFPDRSAA
jgi:c-di-GMP-binding flagellar brake protein YcgR